MSVNTPQPYDLLSFDIRPVLLLIDHSLIRRLAFIRHGQRMGMNPNNAILVKQGCEYDQRVRITGDEIIDDFISLAINSFEHTWVHRNLSHISEAEKTVYNDSSNVWRMLYQCVSFRPEYAGLFAHYQRVNDSIFLAIPKY